MLTFQQVTIDKEKTMQMVNKVTKNFVVLLKEVDLK